MKIVLFFVIFFDVKICENLAKVNLDQDIEDYSKQEKKPEEIEYLEDSDILENELQGAMNEITKTQSEDAPIAISPEVVNALLHNLNYLRKQKQFPSIMQDENFESDFKNPKQNEKAIKAKILEDKIRQQKVQLLTFRENIKQLRESIDKIKRQKQRGDQEQINNINLQLEEYENKYKELQHKLFDKDGQPTKDDNPYNELVQHIDIIKAKIEELSEKLSDMQLKDFDDKDIEDIKELLYEYQLILKDLLQQKVDYLKLKDHQQQQLEKEIQINELNKQKTSSKDEQLIDAIDEKEKELRDEEEKLEEQEKADEEKLDLEKELEILHEKERIPMPDEEKEKIREEEEKIKQQLAEADSKLMGTHRINKIMLKYKLNTKINPMFHNIDPILDEDFKNTDHISEHLYNVDLSLTSYRDLFRVHDLFIKLQFKLENIFKGFLTSVDQIPKDQSFDQDENFVVLEKLSKIVLKIKNEFFEVTQLYERIDRVFEQFDPHRINWVNFYDQQEFQNITLERAKVKHVNVLEVSTNEQEVEVIGQDSISDIEKISVCVKDIGILLDEMDSIQDKFIKIVPPQLLEQQSQQIKIKDETVQQGFEFAKRFINIRIDLENNLSFITTHLIKLQSQKDKMFDKIQELNQMTLDEKEIQDANKPADGLQLETYVPESVSNIFSIIKGWFSEHKQLLKIYQQQ